MLKYSTPKMQFYRISNSWPSQQPLSKIGKKSISLPELSSDETLYFINYLHFTNICTIIANLA